MNNNYYISNAEYYIIRNGLLDNDNSVVKMSIQSLITKLEENKLLNSKCTKDLCAILYRIVQNSDYKIRKWTYHLIAYKNTPDLISRCIENLKDGTENDNENITWIMAIASMMLNQKELNNLYKKYAEHRISKLEYLLCTNIFSIHDINVTQHDIKRIVNIEDFLAKMWLTKMYACVYKEAKKKQYVKVINCKIMNELLKEEKLNRYVLWAFSTFENVNLKRIDIKPCDASKLHIKSQAWYYNCLFKDEQYVDKNRDHVGEILDDFHTFPMVVKGGILRGIEGVKCNLGYIENKLVKIYFELDEEKSEDVSLLISLTKILLKHVNESSELGAILMDTKFNTKIDAIKRILLFYNNEKGKNNMARTINMYGHNQYNEEAENPMQINAEKGALNSAVIEVEKQIKDVREKLQEGIFDSILDTQSVKLRNMLTNIEYELSYAKSVEHTQAIPCIEEKIAELETSMEELKRGKVVERKRNFSNILTKVSEICTVIATCPELIAIVQHIIAHIKNFLNI